MLVSVIIPSHRQPQFLERAIRSCLEQDYTEIEVIVVDDHSRDASLGIAAACAATDLRVKIVACAANGGLGWARNVGVAHTKGEYLCFLDSDDYLLDRSISARVDALPAALEQHGADLVGVYGDWQHVAEAIDHPVVREPRSEMPLVSRETYTGENVFICSAPIVRREVVLDVGGFPEGLPMLEDFAMWAKIIAAGGVFSPVDHVVSTYRQRPNSMLRGDGVVVMADHVQVINNWVTSNGTQLADGGALGAWLAGGDPRSFGRMSWNVPSVLGSAGGSSGAAAVHVLGQDQAEQQSTVEDFMNESKSTGLQSPPPIWEFARSDHRDVDVVFASRNLHECLAAIALLDAMEATGRSAVIAVTDRARFEDHWPLALAGITPTSVENSVLAADRTVLEVSTVLDGQPSVVGAALVGASMLWPVRPEPVASIVYVPVDMADYPALDAWLSTALHALADGGLEPAVVADPRVRSSLGGFRSSVLSLDTVMAASIVVSPLCDEIELFSQLSEVLVFDPSAAASEGTARTRIELEGLIENVRSRVGARPVELPSHDELLNAIQRSQDG